MYNPTDDRQSRQYLRLRSQTRLNGPTLFDQSGHIVPPYYVDAYTAANEARAGPSGFWPCAVDREHFDPDLNALIRLMKPPSHMGNFRVMEDERSLVYSTGSGANQPVAHIFLSFDQAIKLAGVRKWGCASRQTSSRESDFGRNGEADKYGSVTSTPDIHGETTTIMDIDGKNSNPTTQRNATTEQTALPQGWHGKEPAMYRDIGLGYYFGVPRRSNMDS